MDRYNQTRDARMGGQTRIGRWEAGCIAQPVLLGEREERYLFDATSAASSVSKWLSPICQLDLSRRAFSWIRWGVGRSQVSSKRHHKHFGLGRSKK